MPNKKEKGLDIRVPVGDLLKKGKQSPTPSSPFKSGGKKLKPKKKKKKNKLTEQQKKNVDKDATIMEKEDIPGTPHFRMVPKKSSTGIIMKAAKGGLAGRLAQRGYGKARK